MKRCDKDEAEHARILVVADLEYLRDGIQALLEADRYDVVAARGMQDATDAALSRPPDLILVTLDLPANGMASVARGIRANSGLASTKPILVFCIPSLPEGDVMPLGDNTWAARPTNFNQLREILRNLLIAKAT